MVSETSRSTEISSDTPTLIVSLDIGTSSVRTLLFDGLARAQGGFGRQIAYDITTTADGGVEIDPEMLFELCCQCLDSIHQQMHEAGLRPAALAAAGFWHSFLGVDRHWTPATPIVHLLDTRSAPEAAELATRLGTRQTHQRVGCVFHPSYWPAKLLWLSRTSPQACAVVDRWVSFPEFLSGRVFPSPIESTSMMSASGLWDQNRNTYDVPLLEALPIRLDQLASPAEMDRPGAGLRPEFAGRWPLFDGVPWFPAIGDGAANNVGSGAITRDRFALMVGTTGAMRCVIEAPSIEIPAGLWCYRIDRQRFVVGGALSDGGKVFEWMTERLAGLEPGEALERELAKQVPGAHGLTFLPLFAGERSPNWNANARAAITGIGLHTRPIDLLRAALEAVALRFRLIYDILRDRAGSPAEVIATGGALLRSPSWTQMMADALGRPVVSCLESETSSRGAAMLALERLGAARLEDFPTQLGITFLPAAQHADAYAAMLEKQRHVYGLLYP
jgi:gluconokinase